MSISYSFEILPDINAIICLYEKAEMPRPINDTERMQKMFDNSNLIVTAWNNDKLVGVCRCLTDFEWCCYLSDLVVDNEFKKSGIGRKLVELVKEKISDKCMILLLSVPTAMNYYPKIGFLKEDRAFLIPRKY